MSENKPVPAIIPEPKEVEKQANTTDAPILLEIKAQVEKLAGEVKELSDRMSKAEKKPEDEKKPEEEKQAKPEEKYPPEKKPEVKVETPVPEVKQKPEEKKPEEYPYPEKKQIDQIFSDMEALKGNVSNIQKALGFPQKRTTVLKGVTEDKPVDIGKLTWDQCHELAGAI